MLNELCSYQLIKGSKGLHVQHFDTNPLSYRVSELETELQIAQSRFTEYQKLSDKRIITLLVSLGILLVTLVLACVLLLVAGVYIINIKP